MGGQQALTDIYWTYPSHLLPGTSRTKDIKPTHTPSDGSQRTGVAQHVGSEGPALPEGQDANEVTMTGKVHREEWRARIEKMRPSLSLGIDRPESTAPSLASLTNP